MPTNTARQVYNLYIYIKHQQFQPPSSLFTTTNKYKIEQGIEEFEQKVLSAYKKRCQYRERDNSMSK